MVKYYFYKLCNFGNYYFFIGKITTVVIVKCPTPRIYRLLLGTSDGRIRNITENVQRDLQGCFHKYVKIKIVPSAPGVVENDN